MVFDYDVVPPYLTYGVVGADGRLVAPHRDRPARAAAAPRPRDHRALHDPHGLPADVGPGAARARDAREVDLPHRPAGALRRSSAGTRAGDTVHWFEAECCYMYHTINAWETGDEIVLVGCRIENPLARRTTRDGVPHIDVLRLEPYLHEWRFDLVTGTVRERALDDVMTEFPRMDNRAPRPSRRSYSYSPRIAPAPELLFDGFVKYDTGTGAAEHRTRTATVGSAARRCSRRGSAPRPPRTTGTCSRSSPTRRTGDVRGDRGRRAARRATSRCAASGSRSGCRSGTTPGGSARRRARRLQLRRERRCADLRPRRRPDRLRPQLDPRRVDARRPDRRAGAGRARRRRGRRDATSRSVTSGTSRPRSSAARGTSADSWSRPIPAFARPADVPPRGRLRVGQRGGARGDGRPRGRPLRRGAAWSGVEMMRNVPTARRRSRTSVRPRGCRDETDGRAHGLARGLRRARATSTTAATGSTTSTCARSRRAASRTRGGTRTRRPGGGTSPTARSTDDDHDNPVVAGRLRASRLLADHRRRRRGDPRVGVLRHRVGRERGIALDAVPRIAGWGHRTARMGFAGQARATAEAEYVFPHVRGAITDAFARAGCRRRAEARR